MVASAFPNATEAGARMLALGGNAVDADMRYHDGFLRADDLALIPGRSCGVRCAVAIAASRWQRCRRPERGVCRCS